ncbi:MAG TPA: MFS transporter [Thermoanaerobaculia bacterium]|nr:MFS transporter [Thermoanaerobaculia bacterium]
MSPRSNAREPLLTWPFLRLCLFSFLAFIAAFQLFPTIPFHLIELGASRARAGTFLTVYTWASALSAPFMGAVADRFGRRRMLLLSAVAFSVFSVLYGVVTWLPLLLAIACVHGLFWSGMLSATGALVTDVIPPERRTEGIGYYGISATASVAVAPAIGLAVYRHGWLALMLELAALALLLAVMTLFVHEPKAPAREPAPLHEAISWRVVASASGLFLVAASYGAITSYAALLATDRGIAPRSLFFTVFALTVIATRIVLPHLVDRGGRPERLLMGSLLLVPPGLLLLGLAHTRGATVVAAIVFATGFGSAYPTFMSWVLARTDARHRAATFGSVLLAFDTAIGLGSLVVGRLGERLGLGGAFLVLAALSTLAVPSFLFTRRLLPEVTA